MFKLFFQYLDEFIVFWMDNLLIYSQTEEEHLTHLEVVFEKFREVGIKLKMLKFKFFKNKTHHYKTILVYPDPDKQYYLFSDSIKPS